MIHSKCSTIWWHVNRLFHTVIHVYDKMNTDSHIRAHKHSTNTSKFQILATEDLVFAMRSADLLLAQEAGRFKFSQGKCCATYQYASAIYRCLKACIDAMQFWTIPEKSGYSYWRETQIFSVFLSLVYYISKPASCRKFCD